MKVLGTGKGASQELGFNNYRFHMGELLARKLLMYFRFCFFLKSESSNQLWFLWLTSAEKIRRDLPLVNDR